MKQADNTSTANKPTFNKATSYKGLLLVCVLLIGIVIGMFISSSKNKISISRREDASFRLGLVENNLSITNILWSDFPGWRNVEFNIDGTFSVNIPKDATINFSNLKDTNCIKELERESQHTLNGTNELIYDYVTYEITNGTVIATGVLKEYDNAISIAASGYQVRVTWNEGEDYTILGYIPPENAVFIPWTSLENTYANYNLTAYFSAFQLSHTYLDEHLTMKGNLCADINVIKTADGLMNCYIENQSGSEWEFSADLPALEMWYNGVWIEILSPYGSALMTNICASNETYEINVPPATNESYPSLFPGIYRLVVYGVEDDYAISDNFLILFNHDIQLLN